jgi:hypothetical protein
MGQNSIHRLQLALVIGTKRHYFSGNRQLFNRFVMSEVGVAAEISYKPTLIPKKCPILTVKHCHSQKKE